MGRHIVFLTFPLILILLFLGGCRLANQSLAETIRDPKILLCSIGGDDIDVALLAQDKLVYQIYFKNISEYKATDVKDFYGLVQDKRFDIVHISVRIDSDGTIAGEPAVKLLKNLNQEDVKLVIFARNVSSDIFGKAFHADQTSSIGINFIATLDRKGEKFDSFIGQLLDSMAKGETLLTAWAKLAPQAQGPWMENLPDTVFIPNRGDVRFIP